MTSFTDRRGLFALNVTQLCGAANDNVLKQLLIFGLAAGGVWSEKLGEGAQAYGSLCLAIPFVLFSGFAGQFSDRFSKRDVSIVVKLNGATRLEFGDRAALSGLRYVRVGDAVHLIDDRHYHSVNQALADVVDNQILPTGSELTGLDLGAWRLRWTGADWRDEGNGESVDVAAVVRAWSTAQASVVGQLNPEAARGKPLRMTINEPERTLEMELIPAPDGGGIYLARRDLGVAYHFPADRTPPLPPGEPST